MSNLKSDSSPTTVPPMSDSIQLGCTHDIRQGIIVCVDGEMWGIEQVTPKFLTNERNSSLPEWSR